MKDIPGHEGKYAITANGKIWSYPKPLSGILKGCGFTKGRWLSRFKINGYWSVRLGIKKTGSIHRLLAQTFISNPFNKPHVNHIDGNKKNNKISNLEWVTQHENNTHAWRIGLNHKNLKLNENQILKIKELRQNGITQHILAQDFKVGRATIWRVLNGIGY